MSWSLSRLAWLCLFGMAPAVFGQSTGVLRITPSAATLQAGESHSFRAVDAQGRMQHHVTWTVSAPDIAEISSEDETTLTAKAPGTVTLTARVAGELAESRIEVRDQGPLPAGTVMWSSGGPEGCHPIQIVQAVPTADGPDIYETSQCPDGSYVRALTADGVEMWRRRMGDHGPAQPPDSRAPAVKTNALNTRSVSICDTVTVGMSQDQITALLTARKTPYTKNAQQSWLVEETGNQCRLWFNEKGVLSQKRKVLTTE